MQTWLGLAVIAWVVVFALAAVGIAVGALVFGNDGRAAAAADAEEARRERAELAELEAAAARRAPSARAVAGSRD